MLVMLIVATAAVLLSTKGTARPGYLTGSLSESRLNASRTESGLSKVSSGKHARVMGAYREGLLAVLTASLLEPSGPCGESPALSLEEMMQRIEIGYEFNKGVRCTPYQLAESVKLQGRA